AEKLKALKTLRYVLFNLAKLMAPFTPYIAEQIYQELKGEGQSVHLQAWPEVKENLIVRKVLSEMELVRKIVEAGLAARAAAGMKIRQPLASYSTSLAKELPAKYVEIIKDELNIAELKFGEDKLDIELTPKLKEQGLVRELVRFINSLRKTAGLTIADKVTVYYQTESQEVSEVFGKYADEIKKDTLALEIKAEKPKLSENQQSEVKVNGVEVWLGVER
ncbi:MAG: DUF5915 domain-containing protein, partial [Candidatus Parcubacteria bacterium]|nr:DUF5915 domain-containing protein [Candidatus Parcubacteria bacterium]